MSNSISNNRRKAILVATLAMASLLPTIAHADTASIAGVESMAETILNFLTGTIATLAGAIAIAFVGYRWFSGRMEMGKALATVAGIVLVIGSVQIVKFIRAGSGIDAPTSISSS